jgi:membrane-bound lytic murein transglycosylase A
MSRRAGTVARWAGFGAALGLLAACSTTPPPGPGPSRQPPRVVSEAPPDAPAETPLPDRGPWLPLTALPGWSDEDHAGAYEAFRSTCTLAHEALSADACRRAKAAGPLDDQAARIFLEANFLAEPLGDPAQPGLLTAYFAPRYEARFSRQGDFTAPVRPKPADLDPAMVSASPYADRAAIEATDEVRPLAWMRPEDLFFLQIQGSGLIYLPDGRTKKILYAANNGQPFVGIAKPMRERGLLAGGNTSGEAIHQWLADHRGPQADAIMRLNPRYAFFRTTDDDGLEPAGAAGLPLPAGHAIAVDRTYHRFGDLYWIDADAPALNGAAPRYRRLAVALDAGGAIKGPIRADLYLGSGDAAGREAGRVKHQLLLYRLVPAAPKAAP